MEKDVVCGIQVDTDVTANRVDYDGKTFYFCSPACMAKFGKNPETYANRDARIRQHMSAVFTPPPRDPKANS